MKLPYDQRSCVAVMLLVRLRECLEDPQRFLLEV